MVCIYCEHPTSVSNSRKQHRLFQTWRRRKCDNCNAVFTTRETVEYEKSIVVTDSEDKIHPFHRDKLFLSVFKALAHRKDAVQAASALTATICSLLLKNAQEARISRQDVIYTVADVLGRFDAAAATAYMAYHDD